MRSIHSFRSRRPTTSLSNLKASKKRRLKLLHFPKTTSSSAAAVSAAGTTPSAAMHKRLRDLQRLVPAGRHTPETDLNHLFQRTADYIFALQFKLNILKDLTSSYGL